MAATAPWFAYDLSELTDDIDGDFLCSDRFEEARTAVRLGRLPELNIAGQRIGPPVARPHALLCLSMNYGGHAAEAGQPARHGAGGRLQGTEHGGGPER